MKGIRNSYKLLAAAKYLNSEQRLIISTIRFWDSSIESDHA